MSRIMNRRYKYTTQSHIFFIILRLQFDLFTCYFYVVAKLYFTIKTNNQIHQLVIDTKLSHLIVATQTILYKLYNASAIKHIDIGKYSYKYEKHT